MSPERRATEEVAVATCVVAGPHILTYPPARRNVAAAKAARKATGKTFRPSRLAIFPAARHNGASHSARRPGNGITVRAFSAMWKLWIRGIRANAIYLWQPFLDFLPLLSLLAVVLIAGSVAFHDLYQQEPLSYGKALYVTYCLIFMEHIVDYPAHWLLQAFYFGLPPLGLVVILDGIVRFGYHVLRREQNNKAWIRAMAKTHHDHVILCGLGRVGLRVLQQLVKLGEQVVVLEKDADNPNVRFAQKRHIPVLIGSGREDSIFSDLNVAEAKSIILATNDDLANLEMALDARKLNPQIYVVMRMFDQELASKIRDAFDIHQAFSTAAQAAPLFATSSSDPSITNSFYVGDELLVVAHITVSPASQLRDLTIGDLGTKHPLFVLEHAREQVQSHFPDTSITLQAGDTVTVQCAPATLKRIHKLNRPD